MGYELFVRDSNLNRIEPIEDFHNLEAILKFNAPGTWVLSLPSDTKAAQELIKDKYGIIVKKDDVTIFSGPVTGRNRKWNKDGDVLTVNGYDDLIWINNRLAYPVTSGPPYTLQDYDVRTGVAETIIKQYVEYNAGINARSERRVPGLTIAAEQGLGKNITGKARFHNLLDFLQSLALAGGDLGFNIVNVSNNLEFQVYQPTDKTKTVVFSPLLGNLREFDYTSENADANYAIVGGSGEGTARIFSERGDSLSITKYGRIESFIDRRDTTDSNELQQSIDEELSAKAEKTSLSISPVDMPGMEFGKDYNLGDKVSVIITHPNEIVEVFTETFFMSTFQASYFEEKIKKIQDKIEVIQDVVREVKLSITPDGDMIIPNIGTPESLSKSVPKIFDQMKKLRKRLSNLERM